MVCQTCDELDCECDDKTEGMTLREAALILAKEFAWTHRDGNHARSNPDCLLCQALRVVRDNPPVIKATAVRVSRHKED